jgi:hypothetical protein
MVDHYINLVGVARLLGWAVLGWWLLGWEFLG